MVEFDWQQARVYFLTFLKPLTRQPAPAFTARLANLHHRR
jgi:hypothetical protein